VWAELAVVSSKERRSVSIYQLPAMVFKVVTKLRRAPWSGTMAQPPESPLLWVNKDVKSYQKSKTPSPAQAALINAHSQQQARAARTIASQRALRDGSAVKAIVGWRQQSTSPTSSNSSLEDQSAEESKSRPTKDSKRNLKKLESIVRSHFKDPSDMPVPHIPYICGKDEALDPFNCTAAKIDSDMHDIIHFYLTRVYPVSPLPQSCIICGHHVIFRSASSGTLLKAFLKITALAVPTPAISLSMLTHKPESKLLIIRDV
jgi:hypothetical protein